MPHFSFKRSPVALQDGRIEQGFILFEVLIAMSLIVSCWLVMVNSYAGLVLQWSRLQEKRVELNQEMDRYEQTQFANQAESGSVIESARVLGRPVAVPDVSRPFDQNQRRSGGSIHKK